MAEILGKHHSVVESVTLTPSSGGVFEVEVDGSLLFSKKSLGRHAEPGEIGQLFQEKYGAQA